jgi:phosphotriesterase-related protein
VGAPRGQAGGSAGLSRGLPRLPQALAGLGRPRSQIAQLTLGALGRLDQIGGLASLGLRLLRPPLTLGVPGLFGGPASRLHVLRPPLALALPGGQPIVAVWAAVVAGRHEPERRRRPGATEDFESRRPLLRQQPSVSEVLGQFPIDGGAEQGVRDATLGGRRRALAVLGEELASATDQGVELAPLAAQGFASGSGILELHAANLVDGAYEALEALGLGVRQLIGGPQHGGWAAELADGPGLPRTAGGLQRCGLGVSRPGELPGGQGKELLDESSGVRGHGLSVACGSPAGQPGYTRGAVRGRAMANPLSGKALTVLGPIDVESMGVTLPHEHLLIDFAVMFKEPSAASDKGLAYQPVSLSNVGWVRQNFNANLDNLRLLDEQTALDEIMLFRRAGGRTVIDPTNVSLARDPLALARISRATGLNVVMGAGYYVAAAHPADMDRRSEDSIVDEIVREITVGVGETGVRAGLIGEIGNTWPWTENERKVVRAAVEAQRRTGAPLMIHPGRDQSAPAQIVELIGKQGGDLRRTIMCHIDRTIADERHLYDLAASGVWLEYDLFGLENSYYPYNPDFDMPNDGGRMAQILALVARGHGEQILMSHDIAYKSSLTKYGGYGYHHLLVNVVPRLRRKGVDDAGLRRLLVDNPARAFAFA